MVEEKTTLLSVLLEGERRKHGLSERQLAVEIDVAHTTVGRVLRGETVDLQTLTKIANWLGIKPSSLLDAEGIGADALAAELAALIETEPRLAEVFKEALSRVRKGNLDPGVVRDLIAYAAYRFNLTE
jgi:transcriptional regulator with XRE-family HTH domain